MVTCTAWLGVCTWSGLGLGSGFGLGFGFGFGFGIGFGLGLGLGLGLGVCTSAASRPHYRGDAGEIWGGTGEI